MMAWVGRVFFVPFVFLAVSCVAIGVGRVAFAADDAVELYAQDIPASDLVGLLYREIFRKPFITSPQVQAMRSVVSVQIEGSQEHAVSQARDYLAALGFLIVDGKDVDRVEIAPPVKPAAEPKPVFVDFFYSPKWRSAGDLANVLRGLFPEARFSGGVAGSDGGAAGQSDKLVAQATADVLVKIKALVPKLDTPVSDLMVRAAVYEVGTDNNSGSGLQLAISLLGGQVDVGVSPSSGAPGLVGSFVSFRSASVDAILSALSKDGRFRLVTAPTVRARSGSSTKFSVGESVPVLGSVSFPDGGSTPVQSVDYRDAGVIFSVLPVVQEKVISVDLSQEISDFVQTTTGVNNTPTLTKRSLNTTLSMADGDVIMLGGLTKTKDSQAKEGFSFLPDFMRSNTSEVSRTDLLLVLQVQRLDVGALGASSVATKGARGVASPQALRAVQSGLPGLF